MTDWQERVSELLQAVAAEAIQHLPPGCAAARLEASVDTRGDQLGMSVRLQDTSADSPLEISPGLVDRMVEMYQGFSEAGQAWNACQIEMSDGGEEGWDFEVDFDYDNAEGAAAGSADGSPADEPPPFDPAHMSAGFRKLLGQHAAASFEKQQQFAEIGSGAWQMDLETQVLEIEGAFQTRIDLLGSVSTVSNTWLWAWANKSLGAPDAAVASSKQIQAWASSTTSGNSRPTRSTCSGCTPSCWRGSSAGCSAPTSSTGRTSTTAPRWSRARQSRSPAGSKATCRGS